MLRVFAIVVLMAVSADATWCVDGCIDRFATKVPGSTSTASTPSDTPDTQDTGTCVVCITPFEREHAVVLAPAWGLGVAVPVFRAVDPTLPPRSRIEHPPRIV